MGASCCAIADGSNIIDDLVGVHAEGRKNAIDGVHDAVDAHGEDWKKAVEGISFIEMEFPMYVMTMETFLSLDVMQPYAELKARGLVFPWKPEHGAVNFLSHEWLGFGHPDPDGVQLRCMQEVLRAVIRGERIFRSDKDWELYSKRVNYSKVYKDSSTRGSTRRSAYSVEKDDVMSEQDFVASVAEGCVWLDYAAIPQVGVREAAVDVSEKFREAQQKAVNSIPAYVEAATNLWVMAPSCIHVDRKTECNYATWSRRGWCRVEDWVNEFSMAASRPIIVEGAGNVWVEDVTEKLTCRAQRGHSALNGDFTCCRMGHEINGKAFPCDKPRVREVVRNALEGKIEQLRNTGDLINYAWFTMLKPALLGESGEEGELEIPRDSDLQAFLTRFGFKDDVEGKDVPEQPVFFPLFCAATEGNTLAVRRLVEAGADVQRRLLGVGTSSLEAACLCNHTDIVMYLLSAGADLHDSSKIDGSAPIHKAASGGASRTLAALLEKNADINAKRMDGSTALMCAEMQGCKVCVEMLMAAESKTPMKGVLS
eukprot:TRINITY_DN8323_c0_g5_i1.p1 TRINITY_DN8323_c0_g5~~TRINITY_DN8323_c0_g5_i1.p1  ORF type:complete len:539 (-),score=79.80 TRINITY_DN8323_c0_g5_i1:171-1787(-)